jgi:peptidoglycan/xylan/chitin deacetylase (PgdA/CDA1 family)
MVPAGQLIVVMYHYVRDTSRTPWPKIRALRTDDFKRQVDAMTEQFEMATLESALEFLEGRFMPKRPMCLLTFDDGLKDHLANVMPILLETGVQGVFLLPTGALEERRVASVHKNHFLLASLSFDKYCQEFADRLVEEDPGMSLDVSESEVRHVYRWDPIPVATLKYIINFRARPAVIARILDGLFAEHVCEERAFASDFYLTWDDARQMQAAGMVMGGHSHQHLSLTGLSQDELWCDLTRCVEIMRARLGAQLAWPFSYPFGAHDDLIVEHIRQLGFDCAFTTVQGPNAVDTGLFRIRRVDPKDVSPLCTVH